MDGQPSEQVDAAADAKRDDGDDDADAESVVSERSSSPDALDEDFSEAMSRIQTRGSLASFQTLSGWPLGGIWVQGVGEIALPLGEAQARQMIALAHQEQGDIFGYGPWALHAGQFTLDADVWPAAIQSLLPKAVSHSGPIVGTVSAWPCKMLLLERGCILKKAHYSSGAVFDNLGQLIVCLPSAHQGGEIVREHRGRQQTVFASNKPEQCFNSWYSDISPRPIESGYLWVLVCNIIGHGARVDASTALLKSETRPLRHTLRRWLATDVECRERMALYYPLEDHPLDFESDDYLLSLSSRQGLDVTRLEILRGLSANLPFEIFLGIIERKQKRNGTYANHDRIEYRQDDGQLITTLVDLDGILVATDLHLSADHVRPGFFNCLDWKVTSSREGHEGNNAPKTSRTARLDYTLPIFRGLCALMWESSDEEKQGWRSKELRLKESDMCVVFRTVVELRWYRLFEKIAPRHDDRLPVSFFNWLAPDPFGNIAPTEKWFNPVEKGKDQIDPGNQPAAALAFINKVAFYRTCQYIATQESGLFYRHAAKAFIASSAITQMRGTSQKKHLHSILLEHVRRFPVGESIDGGESKNRGKLHNDDYRFETCKEFEREEKQINYIELAGEMTRVVGDEPRSRNSPRYRELFSALVNAYLKNYVGRWPRRASLVRPGVGCLRRCEHLVHEMEAASVGYIHALKVTGSSAELTVTKTRRLSAEARRAWRERQEEASKQLAEK
ncbi:hypothetical protein Trco_006494 [Trichoderma cornu-damae]|uniref:Uncharacterized protein n=1 Tax=Trichoderma cornu-damae TaxID=654480 RepID=A0A9P8QLK7_9HYPO|nr:hypothetical protein Trco_006494 [Trichoderma cornu-damae]